MEFNKLKYRYAFVRMYGLNINWLIMVYSKLSIIHSASVWIDHSNILLHRSIIRVCNSPIIDPIQELKLLNNI